ncbi:MAG TPA: ATP-binding cassette domain-containing protein [Polyangiaceae bacterium]|nr:ATP-binding cassette domain-containing protein [Polyangiaceae bacterium]
MDGAGDAPALEVEELSVALGGVRVLESIDASVRAGRVLAVVGASGAGKSTLFRAIAGELAPHGGRILFSGIDVTRLPLWKRARLGLGYVPQGPNVLLDLTVAQNIGTFERAARVPSVPAGERAQAVRLEHRLAVPARELSGGERRRLELLRALIADPRLLVCDEPFAASDPVHVRALSDLLRGHAARGRAVLFADHRVDDALSICDDAIFLYEGRVVASGPGAQIRNHPAVRGRYMGVAE